MILAHLPDAIARQIAPNKTRCAAHSMVRTFADWFGHKLKVPTPKRHVPDYVFYCSGHWSQQVSPRKCICIKMGAGGELSVCVSSKPSQKEY